ncbi:proteoglycan 4-like [Dermacentor silvarum]|uniref:proteoglycan 4-like n=1 Tax=Dermacentor silvarum TaxID=543639 RepID=UPI002100DDF9|nr:proteoglycan 4-like [Dermacentor silvarum]
MEASTAPKTENGLSSCGVGALSPTSPLLPTTLPTSPGDIVFPPEQAAALKRRPESSSKRLGKKATTPVTAKGGEIKSPPEKTRDKNGAPHGPAASTVPPKTEDHRSSHDGGVLSPTTPLLPISTVLPTSPGDAVSPPEPAPPLRRRTGSGLKRLGKKAVAAVSSKGGDIKSPPEKTPGKKGTSHAQAMAAKSRKKTAMTNTLSPAPDVMSPAHDKASKAANQTANQAATAKAVVSDGKTASRRPSVSMAAAVASEKKAAPISPGRKIMGPRHKTRERIRSGSHTPKEKAPVKRAHSPKPAEAKPSALGFSTATPPAAERGKEAPTTTVTPHASKTKRRKTRGQTFTHKGKLHDDHAFSKAESSKASEGAAIASPTEGGQSLKERPPTLPLGSSLSAVVGEMEDLNRTGDKLLEQLASLLDATSPPRQPGRDLTRTCDPTTSEPAIAPASTEFRTGVREPTSPPSPSLQAPATTEQYDASTANALDSGSRVDAHPRATPATVADDVSSVLVDRSEEQAELLRHWWLQIRLRRS